MGKSSVLSVVRGFMAISSQCSCSAYQT